MILKLSVLALLPIFAAIAFAVVYFSFYQGGYDAPPAAAPPYHEIPPPNATSGTVADPPGGQERQGLLLVDAQHWNAFDKREIISLISKVADRGFDVEFVGSFSRLADSSQPVTPEQQLAAKLRQADSFRGHPAAVPLFQR